MKAIPPPASPPSSSSSWASCGCTNRDGAARGRAANRLYSLFMADNSMKSSYELAMERLRKKDADEGVTVRPVTDAEKAAIAEVRNFYEAKMAEQDVLHQSAMRRSVDPAERDLLEQQF